MKINMGKFDRTIRILIAFVIGGLYLSNIITGVWGITLLIIAFVFAITSFIGFCPLYAPFGFSSKKKNTGVV